MGFFCVFPELYYLLYRMLEILAAIRVINMSAEYGLEHVLKLRTDICEPAELDILCICTITHLFWWQVQRMKMIKALISFAFTRDFVCVCPFLYA